MEAFTPAQVQKASKACTAMCMWVRAMHKYHQVSVMVEPKKKLLAEATAELGGDDAEARRGPGVLKSQRPFTPSTRLARSRVFCRWLFGPRRRRDARGRPNLKAVMDKLERLEKEFNEANDKNCSCRERRSRVRRARLERAKKLIGGLDGERTRWTESCASLELSYAKLVGDALISAATIAYTGAFTPTFRKSMTDHWQTRRARVPSPKVFELERFRLFC